MIHKGVLKYLEDHVFLEHFLVFKVSRNKVFIEICSCPSIILDVQM